MIATMSEKIPQLLQPIEVEAMAAKWALEFAREEGISEAVLEGDLLLVIKALATKDIGLASFGLLIQDAYGSLYHSSQVQLTYLSSNTI